MDEFPGGQDTGAELPLKFRLDRRLVVAKKAELLDIRWPTVCRLELTQPFFLTLIQPIGALCPWIKARWPEWFLPPTVILKKQKVDWKDEFVTEIEAYKLLKPIQGTVVPYFYGEAVYDGSPALVFSAIAGSNLVDLARNKFPESKDQALQKSLEDALKALTSYGVEYRDERLDNFLWADGERAMIIDLEQVKFGTTKCGREATIVPPLVLLCANSGELAIRTVHRGMTSILGVTCQSDGIIVSCNHTSINLLLKKTPKFGIPVLQYAKNP